MKTIDDLKALLPKLIELVFENADAGSPDIPTWTDSYACYDEDGWDIEICFKCAGEWAYYPGDYYTPSSEELIKAWGKVTKIAVYHYDEVTGEETTFTDEETKVLWEAINEALDKIK